jgi:UDP-3-O-[3-hydroxymyristoyl] N-acetylglucosamine deacetylase/3-hydroxyacyl-[acyl-carrier-protein] dehydratase
MTGSNHATLASEVRLEGIGVHSGEPARLALLPADEGTGIRFRRVDLPERPEIPANLDHVEASELGTTLALSDEARVRTVEHLMAALAMSGITNVLIELDGPEVPILDGSFLPFVTAIEKAGTVEQNTEAPAIRVRRPVAFDDEAGSSYVVAPLDGFRVSASIEFEHPTIGRQFGSYDLSPSVFRSEIAGARTFGFEKDADSLRERGLALGSSLDNTVVLDQSGVMNDSLRFPDEFVRHKVGDLVGDLALIGRRIEGHIVAERPSHRGNLALARKLIEDERLAADGPRIVDVQKILQYLPHRYPMLLVDRITDFESGKRITGIKNVTINEPFFQGHYPGHPIMPGVLIIEAMAQVGGLLLMDTIENPDEKVVYFMSLDKVKWRRPVTPGDQLVFQLELLQFRRGICRMRGEGFVDGRLVAEAELMARVMDR